MNGLEQKIIDILRNSTSGLKGKEIAEKVGMEKKKINSLLYNSKALNNMCYQDEAYVWHIKAEIQEGYKTYCQSIRSI